MRKVQREKILRAVVELVSRRGYHDTSVERICKVAPVSFATFRNHFRDKEECFLAAFDETVDEGVRRVAEAARGAEAEWADWIAAGLGALLAMIREEPALARVCLVESLTAGPVGIDRYEAAVRLCIPALERGRTEAKAGSELPPLLEETIAGGVAWAIHRKVSLGEAEAVEALYGDLLETLLKPYLGEEKAGRLSSDGARARG
jgi:AcrR family transcriptional regulator